MENTLEKQDYKKFFNVFPDLRLKADLEELMSLVFVEKIASNHSKSSLKIYIVSTRLIPRYDKLYVQKEIEKQLTAGLGLPAKLKGNREKGRLIVEYRSGDDLQNILDRITGMEKD